MNQVIRILGFMFVRISICFFLLRIFGFGTEPWWRRTLYSIIALSVLTSVSSCVIVLTQCQTLARLWNPSVRGSCWDPVTVVAVGEFNGGKSQNPSILWDKTLGSCLIKRSRSSAIGRLPVFPLSSCGKFRWT